jgi:hypothetical protein
MWVVGQSLTDGGVPQPCADGAGGDSDDEETAMNRLIPSDIDSGIMKWLIHPSCLSSILNAAEETNP